MADQTIGTARIDIEVNNSKVDPGINASKKSVSSLADEVEKGASRQVTATRRGEAALERQIATLGKSKEEIIRWRIEQQTSGEQAARLTAKLEAQIKALKDSETQLGRNGISAKQTAAAMRGVPAQMTDIVTSLQGGQAPLTVLLQQGGQLKDMFGGVVPAAKALGTQLLALINPYTLAAAGAATVAVAWYQAAQDAQAYTKAIALTGNATGVTAGQLASMTVSIAESQKATAGAARDAVTQVVQSGEIQRENIESVARAAVAMQELTGQSIDKTISDYAKLAGDPVAAVQKMNETQHFLTLEVYEHIRALEEQGQYQEAATVATQAASAATVEALEKVRAAQTWLGKGWENVRVQASAAWQEMKGWVGLNSPAEELQRLLAQNASAVKGMRELQTQGRDTAVEVAVEGIKERTARIKELLAQVEQEKAATQITAARAASVTTVIELDKIIEADASKEEKKRREVAKVTGAAEIAIEKAKAAGLTDAVVELEERKQKALAAIEEKYKDKKKVGSTAGASRSAGLQDYKDDLTEERATLAAGTKALQAQYQAREISVADYYNHMRALTQQGTQTEADSLEKQIAYLRQQSVTGRDAITVNKQIGQLEAQLARVRIEGASALQTLDTQERGVNTTRKNAIDAYGNALEASNVAMERQLRSMVDKIGMGDREYEIQQRINDAYADQADKLRELQLQLNAAQIDQGMFESEKQVLFDKTAERIERIKGGYADLAEAEADWSRGASSSWGNYAREAANVAGQTQSLLTGAFSSAEDAMVQFAKTGKLSFSDMANSIIADLARIAAKQAIVGLVNAIAGAWTGGATAQAGNAAVSSGTANINAQLASSWTKNAKGAVYTSPSLSAYSGQVHNTPQVFAFAKGAGVFAEDGPEAIMPLRRGRDGKLGVAASGTGASAQFNTEMNFYGDGTANTQTGGSGGSADALKNSFNAMANEWATRQMRAGGLLAQMGGRR
ncbi:phage tail tape measure protein [Xanthomonas translucens pv. translucens]|uniref:phage tail tape measure protein n=1 Tax=Xanthomonas campestris pv. translucens TaxID=343 RepID=UPI003F726B33